MYICVRKTINLNNLLFFKGLKCIDTILGKEHEKKKKGLKNILLIHQKYKNLFVAEMYEMCFYFV